VDVYVSAQVTAIDGTDHTLRRVLTADYGKRQNCASRLEIDGAIATESHLSRLGFALSQPPLRAPVLAQHTLSHIFSVRPQDRATYFKALFEVTDLDDLRNQIAGIAIELTAPVDDLLTKFDTCVALPLLSSTLTMRAMPDAAGLASKLHQCAVAFLNSAGAPVPETPAERQAAVADLLTDLRSKAFPVKAFERKELTGWNLPADIIWTQLKTYLAERTKVDEQTRQLSALFKEALTLPTIAHISESVCCPLCNTASALTAARVKVIRQHVANTADFNTAETAAKAAVSQLSASASNLSESITAALPLFSMVEPNKRHARGFTVPKLRELLGTQSGPAVDDWLKALKSVLRAQRDVRLATALATALVKNEAECLASLDIDMLRGCFAALPGYRTAYAAAFTVYDAAAKTVLTALNQVLDSQSSTTGWQDYLDIAANPERLRTVLIERKARATVARELDAALKLIDSAKEKVLEDKFSDYSDLIQTWWERLRPDELTFFSAVQPRKGAKRTIDFKAGLSPNEDRSVPKLRDVIAVFSQSQLHCLGLALFLARAQHERVGFIVLDDPVLSSDEDYKVHFNSTVLTALLALPMQVIILTQDHDTWEELENRYRHVGIVTAQLYVETPADGTIIENTSDALLAKINRAKSLARGGHPDLRKECGIQLRDAGERFLKEMLVTERRSRGEIAASLTNYDGKTMEWLFPHVEPLLKRDPSHQGKFSVFKNTVNNACHDNAPPGNAAMIQAHGEIRFLVKTYLGR
jgi:hypothetical protein